jgi:predicted RNase H-like HicB family nuclease
MTITAFEVTGQATSAAPIPVVAGASASQRIDVQVWTAVTEPRVVDQPTGTPALVALEGINRALHVHLYDTEDGMAIADVDTGVFGNGATLADALQDFRSALQTHLAALTEEDALSPSLQHQLDTLRTYFTP